MIGPLVTTFLPREYFGHRSFEAYFKNGIFKTNYDLPGVFQSDIYPNAAKGSLWSLPADVVRYMLVVMCGVFAIRLFGGRLNLLWMFLTLVIMGLYMSVFVWGGVVHG